MIDIILFLIIANKDSFRDSISLALHSPLEFGYPFWWMKPEEYTPPVSVTASITFFTRIGSHKRQMLKVVIKPKLTLCVKEITAFVSERAT